jgi:PhnB protein
MAVKPIPDGFHTVTPCLVVQEAAQLIDFMKQAFQATEGERITRPDGAVMHAEVRIGDSVIMLGEAMGGEQQPLPGMIYLYVDDADTTYQRALRAGATSTEEVADQFWGDRAGGVKDPTGNNCWIATHKEDLSPEEIAKRAEDFMKQQAGG